MKLRSGTGEPPLAHPELWGFVLEKEGGTEGIPEVSTAVRATSRVMRRTPRTLLWTLFALHQQAQNQLMHVAGVSLVSSRSLGLSDHFDEQRFDSLLTAQTENARQHYLRSLITLLRSEGIAFDYGRFAIDHMYLF